MIQNFGLREQRIVKTNKISEEFLKCLQDQCIKELKEDNIDTFLKLLDTDIYRVDIYIDDELVKPIEHSSHHIKIVLVNNITNKTTEVQRLMLVKMSADHYNYFDNSDNINLDIDINYGTTHLTTSDIKIEPKLILAILDKTNTSTNFLSIDNFRNPVYGYIALCILTLYIFWIGVSSNFTGIRSFKD